MLHRQLLLSGYQVVVLLHRLHSYLPLLGSQLVLIQCHHHHKSGLLHHQQFHLNCRFLFLHHHHYLQFLHLQSQLPSAVAILQSKLPPTSSQFINAPGIQSPPQSWSISLPSFSRCPPTSQDCWTLLYNILGPLTLLLSMERESLNVCRLQA